MITISQNNSDDYRIAVKLLVDFIQPLILWYQALPFFYALLKDPMDLENTCHLIIVNKPFINRFME